MATQLPILLSSDSACGCIPIASAKPPAVVTERSSRILSSRCHGTILSLHKDSVQYFWLPLSQRGLAARSSGRQSFAVVSASSASDWSHNNPKTSTNSDAETESDASDVSDSRTSGGDNLEMARNLSEMKVVTQDSQKAREKRVSGEAGSRVSAADQMGWLNGDTIGSLHAEGDEDRISDARLPQFTAGVVLLVGLAVICLSVVQRRLQSALASRSAALHATTPPQTVSSVMTPATISSSVAPPDADAHASVAAVSAATAPTPTRSSGATESLPESPSPITKALQVPELLSSSSDASAAAAEAAPSEGQHSASLEGQSEPSGEAKVKEESKGVSSTEDTSARTPQGEGASNEAVSASASPSAAVAGAEAVVAEVSSGEVVESTDKTGVQGGQPDSGAVWGAFRGLLPQLSDGEGGSGGGEEKGRKEGDGGSGVGAASVDSAQPKDFFGGLKWEVPGEREEREAAAEGGAVVDGASGGMDGEASREAEDRWLRREREGRKGGASKGEGGAPAADGMGGWWTITEADLRQEGRKTGGKGRHRHNGDAEDGDVGEESWAFVPAPLSALPPALSRGGGHAWEERVVVGAAVDAAQLKAMEALKAVGIIDADVDPAGICSRREFSRWMLSSSALLCRSALDRVSPAMLVEGVTEQAFDDVATTDPDFPAIQGLAEAGIISSKLSFADLGCPRRPSVLHSSEEKKRGCSRAVNVFHPDSVLTRQDLVSWKVSLDRLGGPLLNPKKVLSTTAGFIDVDRIDEDAVLAIARDVMAGERGVIGAAFGFTRRFDPLKPVTRAQAAAALACGDNAELLAGRVAAKEQAEREEKEREKRNDAQAMKVDEATRGSRVEGDVADGMLEHVSEAVSAVDWSQLLPGSAEERRRLLSEVEQRKGEIAAMQAQAEEALAKAAAEASKQVEAERQALGAERQQMAEEAERARRITAGLRAEREALAKVAKEHESAKDQAKLIAATEAATSTVSTPTPSSDLTTTAARTFHLPVPTIDLSALSSLPERLAPMKELSGRVAQRMSKAAGIAVESSVTLASQAKEQLAVKGTEAAEGVSKVAGEAAEHVATAVLTLKEKGRGHVEVIAKRGVEASKQAREAGREAVSHVIERAKEATSKLQEAAAEAMRKVRDTGSSA